MKLSKEVEEEAIKEYHEIIEWRFTEGQKITQRLKDEGRFLPGLDSNKESYKLLDDEVERKIKELRKKYHIDEAP